MSKWQCKFNDALARKYLVFKKEKNEFEAECKIYGAGIYISVSMR